VKVASPHGVGGPLLRNPYEIAFAFTTSAKRI
jgi:hypothetical protein